MSNPKDSTHHIVITVSSIADRDKLIKQLYAALTVEPSRQFTVQQDQINRIRIFQNVSPNLRVLIRTYLVIVVPIIVDLNPLLDIRGIIDYKLDETIKSLTVIINKLQRLQGRRINKGNPNATLGKLVDQLHSVC